MNTDSISIELVHCPIDLASLQTKIADPDVGAHGWFFGVTRRRTTTNDPEPKITQSLSYQAHEPMAEKQLLQIAADAIQRFGLTKLVIVHRLGDVPVGQASVVVGCSSPHRPATFEALPWVMDILKRDVPIWKCERYVDETSAWVHPQVSQESDKTP
tara:strand:+ start:359887 stop:360357 length:471 start_codon:yes stop_codon:yes gene_type:complete